MDVLTSILPPELLIFAVAVTFLSGIVKGAIGFAMPLIMVSGMGILLDPKLVVAGIILPIVVSNALQALRGGVAGAVSAMREYTLFIAVVCVMILVSAQFVTRIPSDTMLLVLGVPVTILCAIQIAGVRFHIPPHRRAPASVIAGFLAGALGGLAGTWGPPTVLYLVAVDTPKARQIVVQGVIYGLGSVMLLAGHLRSGLLNAETWPFSGLLLAPALLGMFVGFKLQDRIPQSTFRMVTLWVLLIAGLNLVRRGLMGA